MDFDYFYNREAERFNFLKVPEILVDGEEFKGLSAEAIILYSMLLKRTGMSFKNNWVDKEGRVFIYFTVEEIMKRRNISKPTAIKTLDELDSKKGIGLIERVRLGLGKPNVIYVKDFMSILAVKENDFQKSKNLTSEVKDFNLRSKENELQEVQNLDSNYIENNKSKYSKREYSFGVNGLGTFQNVFLAAEDISDLQIIMNSQLDNYIERLSAYIKSTGKTYKDHKATIRSREISASIKLQAQSQLKAIYKDNADAIVGNCDSTLFLGGKEKTTLKELSETLGKETIDLYNTSETRSNQKSFGLNYQKTGKELMSQDEITVMDGGKCIFQLRGVRPFLSDKYDITNHKNYKLLEDYDKKNLFDIESYMKRKGKSKLNRDTVITRL